AWPRPIQAGDTLIEVYQPQIDSWQGHRLEARAALSVKSAGSPTLSYGVIWITARTEVDKAQGLVTLEDIKVTKASFPGFPQKTDDLLRVIRQQVPAGIKVLGLAQVEANLAVAQAKQTAKVIPVKNDPPQIIFSPTPALLIRIDGQPSLRQVSGSSLLRVINTRSLILLDSATGQYYLYAFDQWLDAPTLTGPWAPAGSVSSALESARQAAVAAGQVDLLEPPSTGQGALPTIYVSTAPTELIETNGPPEWSPIPGTELLYVTNTDAHVFLELRAQLTYVLLSGRWFRARSTSGPWQFVGPNQLPADFAKIPETHPQGVVLASVAGTPQAQEAVIANTIPQTATVVRSQAHLTVVYDGAPQFWPIDSTPLQYAINTPTPVIRVDKTYYALSNGVWFVAPAPLGPWVVATFVPGVIYTVPVTSPLHYVTYVRVYGYTPTVVYVGYTPGYLGTVVTADGVVVYGTGIVYSPWMGTVWYPPPTTYYSASSQFAWGAATGFMMGTMTGLAIGAVAWGGGCCCCGSSTVNVNKTVNNYSVNGSNVYHNTWDSKTVVSSGDKSATAYRTPNSAVVTNNQNNNVYASHDGNVYKKDDGSWQKWNSGSQSWQNVQTTRPSSTTTSAAQSPSPASTPRAQPSQDTPRAAGGGGPWAGDQRAQGQQSGGQRGWGDGESMARDRGFERFSGERMGGFGGFRGFRR
ncbi:MAG: carbohydrate-binding family V/XII, partial [Candidatus Rokuibacteriota bacterium]